MTDRERQLVENWRGDKKVKPVLLPKIDEYRKYYNNDEHRKYMREYMAKRRKRLASK